MSILSVDIGASSGRVIQFELKDKLNYKEIHRFENKIIKMEDGYYYWDIDKLVEEVMIGISKGTDVQSIGIDTWGVDYVLLDKSGNLIRPPFAYRDEKNVRLFNSLSEDDRACFYKLTGVANLKFNTTYQIMSHMKIYPEDFERADKLLFIPDYINYKLCGEKANEYTVASTSQIMDNDTSVWNSSILKKIGLPSTLFCDVCQPSSILGTLDAKYNLYEAEIIAVPSHDTASAVFAAPLANSNDIYISSGTWSLLGIELKNRYVNALSEKYNFTNEGGINNTIRFLKNIMGLWLIQQVRREENNKYSFNDYADMASNSEPFKYIVDVNDDIFLNPESMIKAIDEMAGAKLSSAERARCVYDSLAFSYKDTIQKLEECINIKTGNIKIIGGGSQNNLLNRLTEQVTGKKVSAGPVEATAIGNALSQLIALGEIATIEEARKISEISFIL